MMVMGEEACDISLALGLGGGGGGRRMDGPVLFPTTMEEGEESARNKRLRGCHAEDEEEGDHGDASVDVKGKREGSRKKLRLTKEQSALLEESFWQHRTLNPALKKELADKLNLRARQVEVWFQNRRARTKLKKTEVDCELLKMFCESLTDENLRLKRELHELKAMKTTAPEALVICPSCERVVVSGIDGAGRSGETGATFDAAAAGGLEAKPTKRSGNYTTTAKDYGVAACCM